jgi:peptidoglycan hydrolase CwlO-like protein
MSSAGKDIRALQKKITVLEAKHKKYEGQLEALDAAATGGDRSKIDRERLRLREKMCTAQNDITGYEHQITAIKEGVMRSMWH